MCVYVYIYIYMYACVCIYIYIYIYICVRMFIRHPWLPASREERVWLAGGDSGVPARSDNFQREPKGVPRNGGRK